MSAPLKVVSAAAAVLACASLLAESTGGGVVRDAGDRYLRLVASGDPQLSLKVGLPVEHLPDVSLARQERDAAQAAEILKALDAVPESELSAEDALSRDVLERRLRQITEVPKFHSLQFPVTPYASPLGPVGALFAALPLDTPAEAAGYLALLKDYPPFLDRIEATLREGKAQGAVISAQEMPSVLAFVNAYIGEGGASAFAVSEARVAKLPPEDAARFRGEVAKLVDSSVNPALKRLAAFLAEYGKGAPAGVGLSQYPGGRAYYEWLVRYHTTLDVTPEAVHQIGVDEVARIEGEMAKVREQIGFHGTAAEFRQSLRADPRLFPKTPGEIETRLMSYVKRLEPRVDEYFLRKPKAPYGVKRLDPQLEGSETFGHYQIPIGSDPTGYYYFNGSQLEDRSLLNAGALIAHELIPGHHFQICLASENASLPRFRRELADTAYTEGWGDYSSRLAGEMGLYSDPYDRYGRLSMDMFISTRLVVDTGMNALGWSREKAVAFMRAHLMETDTQIGTESLRYSCDIPGQALAYKMGARTILELREEARKSLGPRFDIRRFHDAVLSEGSLPMPTLERHIHDFVLHEAKP
jgi:uncharacterized protein (DUF885 family)